MPLVISFEGGPDAGRSETFADDIEIIRMGRDGTQCQVVFPPDLTAVGRVHCELRRRAGRYRLILNRDNAVWVDERRAVDGQELGPRTRLRLGADGPELSLVAQLTAELPATTRISDPNRSVHTRLVASAGRSRGTRRLALAAVIGLLAVGVGVGVLMKQLARTQTEVDRVGGKVDTVAGLTESQLAVVEAHGKRLGEVKALAKALDATRRDMTPRFQAVLDAVRPAVHLVLIRHADGSEAGVGTAWAVGPGMLATNAHVAEVFDQVTKANAGTPDAAAARYVVRSCDPEPKTFRVSKVTVHPGYAAFRALWSEFEPALSMPVIDKSGQMQLKTATVSPAGSACDVALLHVEDGAGLAAPLPLASQKGTLTGLSAGTEVAYVGYPMEGLSLFGSHFARPTPTMHAGYVTAVTDFFGARRVEGKVDRGLLVQHSLPAAGGASGSPVVNRQGHVIGLLSAVNFVGATSRGRIGSSAQVNFAQRVDLLDELLKGTAVAAQARRQADWQARMTRLYQSGAVIKRRKLLEATQTWWRRSLASRDRLSEFEVERIAQAKGTLTATYPEATRKAVQLPAAGVYLVVVVSRGSKRLDLEVLVGETPHRPTNTDDHIRAVEVKASARQLVEARLRSRDTGTAFDLYVYGATGTRISPADRRRAILERFTRGLAETEGGRWTARPVGGEQSRTLPAATRGRIVDRVDVDLPRAGRYLIVAIAPGGEDIDLIVAVMKGGRLTVVARDGASDFYPAGTFQMEVPGEAHALVSGAKSGIPYKLSAFEAVREK